MTSILPESLWLWLWLWLLLIATVYVVVLAPSVCQRFCLRDPADAFA